MADKSYSFFEQRWVKHVDLANELQSYKSDHNFSVRDLALQLNMDESYTARRLSRFQRQFLVTLEVADKICTRLGLELPPVYKFELVRDEPS